MTVAFIVVAAAALVGTAYVAHRWPRTALVASALATFADLTILSRLLPAGIELGPIGASEPLLAVTGAVIAVDAWQRGTFLPALRDPILPLAALFIGVGGLSALVNAVPPHVAVLGLVMTVEALAVYFLWRMVAGPVGSAARAVAAVVVVVAVGAFFGVLQVVIDPHLWGFQSFTGRFGEGQRITSFFGNPNIFGLALGLALPFPLFAGLHLQRRRDRWIAIGVAFLIALALVLTFSRGAWLSLALGGLIGTVILDRRATALLAALVALSAVLAVGIPRGLGVGPDGPEPFAPDLFESTVDRFSGEGDVRLQFLVDGLEIIDDNLLLGVGPGRYGGAAAAIFPSPIYDEYDASLFGFRTVHNFWLHLVGEVGVLGTAVFLTMVVSLFQRYVHAARRSNGMRFALLAGLATSLLVISVNNLTEMLFEGNFPAVMIWLLLGIGSVLAPAVPVFGSRGRELERRLTALVARPARVG